jgi:hypothetical protein
MNITYDYILSDNERNIMMRLLVKGFHEDVRHAIDRDVVKIRVDFRVDVIVDYIDGYSREPTVEIVTDHEEVTADQERVVIRRLMNVIRRCESVSGYHGFVSATMRFSRNFQG